MCSGCTMLCSSETQVPYSIQDMQCVENCSDPDPTRHVLYEQPVWQTLQMFRMSLFQLDNLTLTYRLSRRNALLVTSPRITSPSFCVSKYAASLGFLPVVYAWFKLKYQPAVRLDDEEEPLVTKSSKDSNLDGWKILLLWIPAACDLTGTTVSLT